ncbi:6-pyruvoyl trahydropterin synthase family protein [Microvirga aerophila]|uniref:6-carboxy-5,6,7,8-tetrahydropterin synthase n=1 Tax=Microvirga aerophila TaxID=670291 RepID=A0A512BKX0_9HYPH|nr:6-carboxytetrahydropterin synthase [Microvirga aerophila]GEO12611.1 6-carboxy-5,6,7,8-tetrahydropterin synthase [Microvirga aerophila]
MFGLSKQFWFEAAHTLQRTIDAEPSRRIHGHSYRAEVTVRGVPDLSTGMVVDLGLFERALDEARDGLDHRFLDEVQDLGPATMENLSAWIWRKVAPTCTGLARVTIYRDSSGDMCGYLGPLNGENRL